MGSVLRLNEYLERNWFNRHHRINVLAVAVRRGNHLHPSVPPNPLSTLSPFSHLALSIIRPPTHVALM